MVTKIEIDGFKSFRNFKMYFEPFTVIAGTNASGKSNLFDALQVFSSLAEGEKLETVMHNWRGEEDELFMQFSDGSRTNNIFLAAEFLVDKNVIDEWNGMGSVKFVHLRYELTISRQSGVPKIVKERLTAIPKKENVWMQRLPEKVTKQLYPKLESARQQPFIEYEEGVKSVVYGDRPEHNKRGFSDTGGTRSLLSRFENVDETHIFAARQEMRNWRFLHLNPSELRKPSSKDFRSFLDDNGRNLAATLFRLKKTDKNSLTLMSHLLNVFIPDFVELDVVDDVENRRYLVQMRDKFGLWYSSRLLSEGTLRLLALCAMAVDESHHGVLCFEEPENGINPQRLKAVINILLLLASDLKQQDSNLRQIIVNTHSPLIVKEFEHNDFSYKLLCLSRMVSGVTKTAEGKKLQYSSTRISPVINSNQKAFWDIDPHEQRLTAKAVEDYLMQYDGRL